jgi:hypothetical protein
VVELDLDVVFVRGREIAQGQARRLGVLVADVHAGDQILAEAVAAQAGHRQAHPPALPERTAHRALEIDLAVVAHRAL